MLRHQVPVRIIALIIGGFHILAGAETESVRTWQLHIPDRLAATIAVPLPPAPAPGLQLTGWAETKPDSTTLAAISAFIKQDSIETLQLLDSEQAAAIRRRAPSLWEISSRELETWSEIDRTGKYITFYEDHDGTPLKVSATVQLEWYIPQKIQSSWQRELRRQLSRSVTTDVQDRRRGRRTLELIGADIAGQRVALSVTGNVAIKGGMIFKDQSKSLTNFRANKNWQLDVDQTQRFDIEGTIGDRVSILVHQDSENAFEFENDMKIAYRGAEDEILKSIDAGNISLSLPGTQFATGGGGKSSGLFGLKSVTQFGPLSLTSVASIERSRKSTKSNTLGEAFAVSDQHYIRGRYFFLDTQFRNTYYPLETLGYHSYNRNRVVGWLEVYRSSVEESDTYPGTAYIDPDRPDFLNDDKAEAHFKRLELGKDYTFDAQLGWIRLAMSAGDRDIIAVAYSLGRQIGADSVAVIDTVGDLYFNLADSTDIDLKLIKNRGQTSTYPTWPLEFKNVYSLGGMNIRRQGFHVRIVDRKGDTGPESIFPGGENYLRIFGLDRWDSNQNPKPDDSVDVANPSIVNLSLGELHFPALLPFAYANDTTIVGQEDGYVITTAGLATSHLAIKEIYGYELEDQDKDFRFDRMENGVEHDYFFPSSQAIETEADGDGRDEDLDGDGEFDVPAIYYKPKDINAKNEESRFDIAVQQTSRGASVFNLGFNWVPGSETVFINGVSLTRDKDYKIDEMTGTLTILEATMANYSNPEVTIEYEDNILISFDKRVMLGTRAELDLGENSFLGLTGLYYNQSIADERVDVGSEPVRNMLWDFNGRFARETPFITRLVDRLPLLETDAVSKFRLEGELAQVIPDPNPLGTAYIDDFEASKNITSPSLRYTLWQQAAPPVDKNLNDRRKLAWWNPYRDWPVREIWPQRETSVTANNQTTTILVLDAFFERFGEPVNDSLWGGITYQLMSSEYDQSKTKFFEIWLRGEYGQVQVDIGTISEDINGNGETDTEDQSIAGLMEGNGILDAGEDVGLDGCSDEDEDGLGGCLGIDDDGDGRIDEDGVYNEYWDGDSLLGFSVNQDLAVSAPGADPSDPNGDNWARTESNNYNDNINGTEGNSATTEGSYPDSEDLDGNGTSFIDNTNDYFSYSFRLEGDHPDTALVAGETRRDNGSLTHWRLFRIPLVDFQPGEGMTPSWNDVKQLRLWVDGISQAESLQPGGETVTGRIEIAKIELVGNEWEEIGIAPTNSDEYERSDSLITLAVTVANTEDNADYESPPGIKGEYDRLNDIRLREQSLVMDFKSGIEPGFKGGISKSISQQRGSFLVYGTMDMFIHGQAEDAMMDQDPPVVWFFLRLGRVTQNGEFYYEVRQPVYPGWDDRNHIHIDMERIAALKLEDPPDSVLVDGEYIPKYYLDDREVLIRGDPSLERIETYTAGVINKHSETIRGQVMMDELRLSNVRRERGMALRVSGALNFADLLTTSINYSRKDADFHTIQQRVTPNPVTTETIKADAKFSPDRFLPRSWKVLIPISIGYSRSIQSPKYYSGRDVLAGGLRDAPEEIQRISRQVNLRTSFAKSSRSRYWLGRQTLDRLTGSVAYARKQTSSEQELRNITQNISGQAAYPIKFSDENYLEPFRRLEPIPWLGAKLKDTRIYYSPSNLDFSTNIAETKSARTTRDTLKTTTENYTLSLKRAVNARYRLTDRLSTSYSWSASNALDHLRLRKWEALKALDMGHPLQLGEQYSANFDPTIFSWFRPKLTYQARYSWNKNRPIVDDKTGGRVSNQGRLSGTVNLEMKSLVEIFYTPESKGQASSRSRRRRRTGQTKQDEQKKLLEVNNLMVKGALKHIHAVLSKVNPIAFSYAYGRTVGEPAVIGQPDIKYRLGLATTTGLPIDSTINGFATLSRNRDMSWRTGFNIGRSVNVSLSHSRKWTSSQGANATTESRRIDFLVLSDGEEVGLPFINWSLRWSNLEKLPLLKKVPWRVSLDHSYSGSKSSNKQGDRVSNDTYTRQFQPLLGLTINFTNGISTNLRYSQGQNLSRTEAGDNKGSTRNITASASYQHRGGLKLPLPFLRDLNLQNSINFSLDFDLSNSLDEQRKGEAVKFSSTRESRRWGIKPYITYTFSNKVTGSFRTGYSETYNERSGRRIDREFGFDVNIAIRGS